MIKNKRDQVPIDFDKCTKHIGSRFNLVLVAGARARELGRGHAKKVLENNSNTITALREIEQGLVGLDYLRKL